MTQCIGRMGGNPGDWFAELDFENGEAQVIERGRVQTQVCVVPLGEWIPETEDNYASLNCDCPQAKRLCKIVFAPEAWATLASIKSDIESRYPNTQEQPGEMPMWAEAIVDQIERTLECLDVPGVGQ